MAELEQVERLREKANVTFAEAKEALDAANGDILEALIYLENQGKATVPAGGGFFTSNGTESGEHHTDGETCARKKNKHNGETFWEMTKRFGRFCLRMLDKGNNNFLVAYKNGGMMFSIPVTVVVLLLICFWITVPLFVVSLFCGLRYRFQGVELGKDSVNKVMDSAADVVEDVKKSFTDGESK